MEQIIANLLVADNLVIQKVSFFLSNSRNRINACEAYERKKCKIGRDTCYQHRIHRVHRKMLQFCVQAAIFCI